MKIYKEILTGVFLTLFALIIGLPMEVQAQDKTVNLSAAGGSQMMSKTSKMASVGRDLTQLYNEFETFSRMAGLYAAWHFKAGNRYLKVDGGYVTVDAVAAGDPAALKAELEALNMRGARSHGAYVSGHIPISAIPKMANSKNLKFARPAYFATNAGITVRLSKTSDTV